MTLMLTGQVRQFVWGRVQRWGRPGRARRRGRGRLGRCRSVSRWGRGSRCSRCGWRGRSRACLWGRCRIESDQGDQKLCEMDLTEDSVVVMDLGTPETAKFTFVG